LPLLEKGEGLPFPALEPTNLEALAIMKRAIDQCGQDWEKFYRQTVEFHRRNALAWLNTTLGEDVTTQIDPDFSLASAVRKLVRQEALSN
jgi:CO dehydrogenase maturation factor